MAKIKFKVLVEELDATKPAFIWCGQYLPEYWCDVIYLVGPI
jgi:hypothetical protein